MFLRFVSIWCLVLLAITFANTSVGAADASKRLGKKMTAVGTCEPPYPFPANNDPAACCSQPDLDYCGGNQCCDIGYCQSGRCCPCQTCNDRQVCCPGEYPTGQTCAVTSSNAEVCSAQKNLCIDDDQSQGRCGELIRMETGRLPLTCDNTVNYCDLGTPGMPYCGYIPACIWDYQSCTLPGPLALPNISPASTKFSCDLAFDKNKCRKVTGKDCGGELHTFTINKNKNCLQAITHAHPPMSAQTMRFADSCIPKGWTAGPKNCAAPMLLGSNAQSKKPQLRGGFDGEFIYRVLRAAEGNKNRIFAKNEDAAYTVGGHITMGNKLKTQYLSASTDLLTSIKYCLAVEGDGRHWIVRLSVAKLLAGGCKVIDVKNGEEIKKNNKRARNFARSQDEVLISGPAIDRNRHIFSACRNATDAITLAFENCGR